MASRLVQNNFSGGVLSPSLYGRSDLQSYYKGCAKAENFTVSKEGSLRKRRGIASFMEIDTSATPLYRVIPYHYDRTTSGLVVLASGGTDISATLYRKTGGKVASVTLIKGTFTEENFRAIQHKQIGDEIWVSNGSFFRVLTISNFAGKDAGMSVSVWEQAEKPKTPGSISATRHDNNGDTIDPSGRKIDYAAYVVRDGVRSDRKTVTVAWYKDWPAGYYIEVKVQPSTEEFDYVLLAKRIGGNYGEVARWYPEDIDDGTFTFRDENISAGEAVYTQTSVLGEGFSNPLCVDCFQQRKVFANADTEEGSHPMTMWFSETGNLDNFYANRPSSDADAFSPTISSTGPSFILWVVTYQEMMVVFTESGLFTVGFSQQAGFSASTCRISRFSNLAASADVQPVVTDAGVVFLAADNKTIYSAAFDLQENMLKPINRLVLAEHLTRRSQIRAMALQSAPDNVVWAVTEDGRILSFTFERNEEVFAWSEGRIEGARVKDVISLGSVTDSATDRTYTDMLYVVERDGRTFVASAHEGYCDNIGGVRTDVKATLVTLRPESQERTISGVKKNVKDILLRLYETGGLSVAPAQGGEAVELVPVCTGTEGLFTGDVKVMPRGFVNESGQMTFVSANDKPCEILQIVTALEVME
jgi:hypothetical protein